VRAGYWLDPYRSAGIEAQFFILERTSTDFGASSPGNPILAQPFLDVLTGGQAAQLIAFPGTSSGSIAIQDSSRLLGAGVTYRTELCRTCAFGSVSGIVGYRFLSLRDSLAMSPTIVALGPAIIPGTTVAVTDQFDTANYFHGLDLGLKGEVARGPWTLTWLAKIAVGGTFTNVDINGATTITVPGAAAVTTAGGIYALPTNIGRFGSSRLAVASELAADVSYRVTPHLRAFAGWSVLYWTGLVRPGGTIDTALNPNQFPPGLPLAGPARPQPQFDTTDYWAQGFNVGLAYDF